GALSPGGGVHARTAKAIPITPQVRAALGITAEVLTPAELISALLRAPVDLLWNGGIGTYVKATSEAQAAAGDRTNDALRINASELRCRVVAEGGNLGLTQRARVEYARAGGLVNTDAIDNSAGVDCSDHEVNIKILLDAVVAAGRLSEDERNELLAAMADDVAELVLQDNREQNRTLTNARAGAPSMIDVHTRLMRHLEETGRLDRALEFLPSDEELAARAGDGIGLVVPELAVLLAYVKIDAFSALLDSDLPDEAHFRSELLEYFPEALRSRFAEDIAEHPLRREIVATRLANTTVNFGGTSLLFRVGEETGAGIPDIVRAHVAAREVFGADGLRARIEHLRPRLDADTHVGMVLELRKLVERATRWFLRHGRTPFEVSAAVERYGPPVAALLPLIPETLGADDRAAMAARAEALVAAGVPSDLAHSVAGLEPAFSALDVVEVAERCGWSTDAVAGVYFALGQQVELDWLRDQIGNLPRGNRWQALARDALRDDLYQLHATLTAQLLSFGGEAGGPDGAPRSGGARAAEGAEGGPEGGHRLVEAWVEEHAAGVERARSVVADVRAAAESDVAALTVAVRELRALATPVE
ncbi:MAG TPA: NAD-glutamate dehydrogenase domain-containing protein, partial [Acidimicrobiales bacterium]|nr:NAD-glutamate dehydrogenase domain-containing protein [Acidimicrobiales bacterium]